MTLSGDGKSMLRNSAEARDVRSSWLCWEAPGRDERKRERSEPGEQRAVRAARRRTKTTELRKGVRLTNWCRLGRRKRGVGRFRRGMER
jgi:hypothetical protein